MIILPRPLSKQEESMLSDSLKKVATDFFIHKSLPNNADHEASILGMELTDYLEWLTDFYLATEKERGKMTISYAIQYFGSIKMTQIMVSTPSSTTKAVQTQHQQRAPLD